jgi:hypothetical protein
MPLVFRDPLFDAQWLRAAGHSCSGGAEVSECFAVARQIREPDAESWFNGWYALAEAILAGAEKSRASGRRVSALGAFLRASNYFRAAYTFLIGAPVDLRVVDAYRRHRAAFEAAVALMFPTVERITIPYGDATMHGYLFRAGEDGVPRRTFIINGGYDSTAEEAYLFSGAAVARGYTTIVFDGPGQGAAIIENQNGLSPRLGSRHQSGARLRNNTSRGRPGKNRADGYQLRRLPGAASGQWRTPSGRLHC